jgi:glycine/D-amino acid oxidase-like deaminating enzyme
LKCGVLVVGGGVAGMSAALAASRGGARTLLIERELLLGGILRTGLGFPVCGLFDSGGNLLNGGICRDLRDALDVPSERMGLVYVWPCPPRELLALFDRWLASADGLTVLAGTTLTSVEQAHGRLVSVIAGGERIVPQVVVDCSGAGAVVSLASAAQLPPEAQTLAGFSVRFAGLGEDPLLSLKIAYVLRKADLPHYLRFSAFLHPDCVKLAVPSDIEPDQLQRDMVSVVRVLREKVPAFRAASIVETSPSPLSRQGARLEGEYVLTKADVLGCARFDDAVAAAAWPIERWDVEAGQSLEYLPQGGHYEIPFRSLQSARVPNLLAAGRCISATSAALASTRVMGTCMALGEAAGIAAAERCI